MDGRTLENYIFNLAKIKVEFLSLFTSIQRNVWVKMYIFYCENVWVKMYISFYCGN